MSDIGAWTDFFRRALHVKAPSVRRPLIVSGFGSAIASFIHLYRPRHQNDNRRLYGRA